MAPILTLLLVVAALVIAGAEDPQADARTFSQMVDDVRGATWKARVWWLCRLVGLPLVAIYYAARTSLYLLACVTSVIAVKIATWTALDGRVLRVYRVDGRMLA